MILVFFPFFGFNAKQFGFGLFSPRLVSRIRILYIGENLPVRQNPYCQNILYEFIMINSVKFGGMYERRL
jgi:hypothetical protein